MPEVDQKQVEKFLRDLMDIQRRFAHEAKGAKTNRREEVRELLDRSVPREVDGAN
jgi:hypothetical protein